MRRAATLLPVALLAWLLPAGVLRGRPVRAAETVTAAETTERGRSVERILDLVLLPEGQAIAGERSLLLLLDPTASLQAAALPEKVEAALGRHAAALGATKVGVLRVGGTERCELLPPARRAEVAAEVRRATEKPETSFQNVYADLRRAASLLQRRPGRRDVLLVTLENGDLEDDLEGTGTALRQANVRLFAVGRQAFLSDTWWLTHPTTGAPSGTDLAGPESAFVELPWGWLLQQNRPTEAAASGYPIYGLSYLAAATGGRVFLWYPPSATPHQCTQYGTCPFCTGDHLPRGEGYEPQRLRAFAPVLAPRKELVAEAARDPWYRAVLDAWDRAAREGLCYGRPTLDRGAGGVRLQRNPRGDLARLGDSIAFPSQAARSERLLAPVEEILRGLEQDVERLAKEGAPDRPRARAIAETTRVELHLLRVNLLLFAAWCREVGPVLAGRKAAEHELPEIPFYADGTRFVGIGWTTFSLCHGVRPFLELYLPGGEEMRREIEALDAVVAPFLERYAHTPFAAAIRQSGIAQFHLTVRGKYVPPPKRQIPGSTTDSTTTPSDRPARGGPAGTGGGGGAPTTGGG